MLLAACSNGNSEQSAKTDSAAASTSSQAAPSSETTDATASTITPDSGAQQRQPNELGRIPILEYHIIGDKNSAYTRERETFRKDLEDVYARGYRPVNITDILDKKLDLPRGMSPVVFVFDDASPEQFSYIEKNGQLVVDPNTALGIWQDFQKKHPDWGNKATWCVLSAAQAGHAFFGEKNIHGQKSEWRFKKLKYLADQGYEICNHTLWHAQLSKYPDAFVQEQIARLQLAVDSALPGYKIRTLALPQGLWPKNRDLAHKGSWTDPKTKKTINYNYESVLEVAGGPTRSPYDPQYKPLAMTRIQATGKEIENALNNLDKTKTRYVSDGNPKTIAR